jgi:H+/Cl- antiporter ClcA
MRLLIKDLSQSSNKNIGLIFLSLLVGLAAGTLASFYRLVLSLAEKYGMVLYQQASRHLIYLMLLLPALLFLSFIVSMLMKKYPMSSGSGIPQVKGQLLGYFKPDWFSTAWAKFVGGTLAMFAGLSLGREGPSIQLGAAMGQAIGQKFSHTERHQRLLIASGASAGLSAAFNAPLSGIMFTLEEVFKYFSPLILLTCMTSAIVADAVSRLIFGSASIFDFQIITSFPLSDYWLLLLLGILMGIFGAVYNYSLLQGQRLMKLKIHSPFLRVLLSFVASALIALFFPLISGSGHHLIDQLTLSWGLVFLCLVFISKFFISIISYASGVPGGIFFPLLVLGASLGSIFATVFIPLFHLSGALFPNFIILAMAATFTAIVRAPMTGILLLVEMTGSFDHLLPLAFVSLISYLVAEFLHSEPIYHSLLNNLLATDSEIPAENTGHIMIEVLVQFDSKADHELVQNLALPEDILLVSIQRNGEKIIPRGDTTLYAGDIATFLTTQIQETRVRQKIKDLFTDE